MDDLPRQQLRELLARYGRGLLDDPRRLEALLRDLCPQQRREVSVLVGAARERVPADLLTSSQSVPQQALVARLQQRLQDNLGLAPDAARWAVEAWGLALGLLAPADLPPAATAPPPAAVPPPAAARPPVGRAPGAGAPEDAAPAPIQPSAPPSRPATNRSAAPQAVPLRPAGGSPPGTGAAGVPTARLPVAPAAPAAPANRRSGGRAWLWLGAAVIAVVAVSGVVAAGRKGNHSAKPAATTVGTAAPCYTGTTPPAPALGAGGVPSGPCPASGPPSNPDALYRALLAASFSAGELPPGFSVHDITSRPPRADEVRLHAVGVVIVEIDSSTGAANRGQIEYVVYPSDAGAQADYDASRTGQVLGGTVIGNFATNGANGLPGTAVCQFGTNQATPAAACLLRSGQTVVQSFASRQADQTAAEADAVALASDAVAHLQRVRSGH